MHHNTGSLADIDDAHPTFITNHPHSITPPLVLASLMIRTRLHLALSPLDLDDRFKHLEVATRNRSKVRL